MAFKPSFALHFVDKAWFGQARLWEEIPIRLVRVNGGNPVLPESNTGVGAKGCVHMWIPNRMLAVVFIFAVAVTSRAGTLRVDSRSKATLPDGLTWSTAFPTVQAGLNKAVAGDEVWVAAGTYAESVRISAGVGLYGGFAGNEPLRSSRDPTVNLTVLKGSAASSVVTLPAAAAPDTVLDGFTITNGGGTSVQTLVQTGACSGRGGGGWRKVYFDIRGGGVLVAGGSPTISNNVIVANNTGLSHQTGSVGCHSVADFYQAGNGGGIYVAPGATPSIAGNVIQNNSATIGGGVYCGGAGATIANNIFSGNSATANGGGLGTNGSALTVSGNTFVNNTATTDGGGFLGVGDVRDNRFDGNHAGGNGGGMSGGGTLAGNAFVGNSAVGSGGGLDAISTCAIERCAFRTNTALDGAGMNSTNGPLAARNSVFADNVAAHSGAAIVAGGNAVIDNNTVENNASPTGSVVLSGPGAGYAFRILFVNNIVALNQTGLAVSGAQIAMRSNDFWHNPGNGLAGGGTATGQDGNISADPLFVDAAGGDLHLGPGSPCIDAGDTSFVPLGSADLDYAPRLRGKSADMGAFESAGETLTPPTGPLHVTTAGNDTSDGSTWASAKASVQTALDAAWGRGGAEVWIAKGTYTGPFSGKAPVQIYGGFAGDETSRGARNWTANPVVLDGAHLGSVLYVDDSAEGAHNAFTLDGFDVKNGNDPDNGGGLTCGSVALTIANDVIEANTGGQGAGINALTSIGTISNNLIRNNQSLPPGAVVQNGGGILANAAVDVLSNTIAANNSDQGGGVFGGGNVVGNVISGNTAQNGAGLYACNFVARNLITLNVASYAGGGAMFGGTLEDNLFDRNSAGGYGGGADIWSGMIVKNNTFVDNRAPTNDTLVDNGGGGAVNVAYGNGAVTPAMVSNNIIAFNSSGVALVNPNADFVDNDVFGNTDFDWYPSGPPAGNLAADPLFVNRNAHSFQLQPGSPCIDAGDDSMVALGDMDLLGEPRRLGAHVDIGAYEFALPGTFSIADASRALAIAGGLLVASPADESHLGLASAPISSGDAVRIARKAVGLDPNP